MSSAVCPEVEEVNRRLAEATSMFSAASEMSKRAEEMERAGITTPELHERRNRLLERAREDNELAESLLKEAEEGWEAVLKNAEREQRGLGAPQQQERRAATAVASSSNNDGNKKRRVASVSPELVESGSGRASTQRSGSDAPTNTNVNRNESNQNDGKTIGGSDWRALAATLSGSSPARQPDGPASCNDAPLGSNDNSSPPGSSTSGGRRQSDATANANQNVVQTIGGSDWRALYGSFPAGRMAGPASCNDALVGSNVNAGQARCVAQGGSWAGTAGPAGNAYANQTTNVSGGIMIGGEVSLTGCGLPEANGTYRQVGLRLSNGAPVPMYSRKGTWYGREAEYVVYLPSPFRGRSWIVATWSCRVIGCTQQLQGSPQFFLYENCNNDGSGIPPESGWTAIGLGEYPPPTCRSTFSNAG